jgi:prevent-host-death family protein
MTMIVINVNEAKAKCSEYLGAAAKGERVVICKRNAGERNVMANG